MEFLKNATISVPLKYLSNFWRSVEIQLVIGEQNKTLNGQTIVLSTAGADDDNANTDKIILTIKDIQFLCNLFRY